MANPNLAAATTCLANSSSLTLSTTAETLLIANPANSNKVLLFDSIVVANFAATAATITITYYPNAATNTGGGFRICSVVSVAANSSLYVLNKSLGVSLREGQSIYANSNTANAITINAFFKEFS